jgi:hypothetical protein
MAGGTTEVHRDDEPLIIGTHDGANAASVLRDMGANFRSFGARVGLAIENSTKGYLGTIKTVTKTEITVLWSTTGVASLSFGEEPITFGEEELTFGEGGAAAWDQGDTYKIYKTSSKGSLLSSNWVDVSAGWKTPKWELERGWRKEDVDIDRDRPGKVFGPGQPSKGR